jgi:acyl-CoA hydrolase
MVPLNAPHSTSPASFSDADAAAARIIEAVGKTLVVGIPLGLGKPNHLVNALVKRAGEDRSISLKIFTALTLEKPAPSNELQRRFIGPVIDRLFGAYPELTYADALRNGTLPANIEIHEFFLMAGRWLGVDRAQQSYIAANYTHVVPMLIEAGINVVAQLVSPVRRLDDRPHYSLSCNPDLTLDLLKARREGRANFLLAGQVNDELPFMGGDAAVSETDFSHVLSGTACQFPLYAPPNQPVPLSDYAAALHAARLVQDGGTIQIGIGSIGDALAKALILRHKDNGAYRELIHRLDARCVPAMPIEETPFRDGLYGLSEMLVSSFLDLIEAGIVKREVDGALLHSAFFLGPKRFYERLRDMSEGDRAKLAMTSVGFVNEAYGGEDGKRQSRVKARFFNKAMMVTLLGAVVSDGLESGQVVSGVGGQYNFIAQAFALPDARAIIFVDATRQERGETVSNIRWSYGRETIPCHLRDIVVTEYGVADLRGKPDAEVIKRMVCIADARFQEALLDEAKKAGKVERTFTLPRSWGRNRPDCIAEALGPARATGILPDFPFGSDFTPTERQLIPALRQLQQASGSQLGLARLALTGAFGSQPNAAQEACLARMGLSRPRNLAERAYRAVLKAALAQSAQDS